MENKTGDYKQLNNKKERRKKWETSFGGNTSTIAMPMAHNDMAIATCQF